MEHFHCFAAFFAQSLAGLFAWHHFVKIITAHVAMLESRLLHNCHLCRKNYQEFILYIFTSKQVNRSIRLFLCIRALIWLQKDNYAMQWFSSALPLTFNALKWTSMTSYDLIWPLVAACYNNWPEISNENQACYTSKYHRLLGRHDDHCVWTKNDCAPIFLVDIKNR